MTVDLAMRILAVDTATRSCSVAVTDRESLLAEATYITQETHAKHLMEMIEAVLTLAGSSVADLDGFAVTRGPGSFTGLRIGISAVKGLAAASGKPIVGVSTLDVLVQQSGSDAGLICPFLDARRGEVYFSRYRIEGDALRREMDERVSSPEEAMDGIDEACIFAGNGADLYRDTIVNRLGGLARFAPEYRNTIRASSVALLSIPRFSAGDADDLPAFAPKYVRRSDAELKRERSK